jgi:hypothetical protein
MSPANTCTQHLSSRALRPACAAAAPAARCSSASRAPRSLTAAARRHRHSNAGGAAAWRLGCALSRVAAPCPRLRRLQAAPTTLQRPRHPPGCICPAVGAARAFTAPSTQPSRRRSAPAIRTRVAAASGGRALAVRAAASAAPPSSSPLAGLSPAEDNVSTRRSGWRLRERVPLARAAFSGPARVSTHAARARGVSGARVQRRSAGSVERRG